MSRNGRNALRRVGAVALALIVSSCRRDAPTASRLVIGLPSSALSLDPYLHDEESTYTTLEHFYERLVAFGPEMELVPELALTWQNPSDTTWRIRLRRGVVFHDGHPFGAEDVAASILRARSLPGSRVAYYLEGVTSVRTPDSDTVEIETARPSPVLLNRLAFIAIVPRDAPIAPIRHPVGTGPYRFVRGAPGAPIEGERFDGYWGPRPAWPTVRFLSLPDARKRAEAVPSGVADAVARFPHDRVEWAAGQTRMKLYAIRGEAVTLLGFDTSLRSPFHDLDARRAVAAAIDRAALVPDAERRTSTPIDQFVPAGVFGHLPGSAPARPDPAEAKRLLDASRLRETPGLRLTFADTHADVGRALVRQLVAAGIRVAADPLPQPDLYARFSGPAPPHLFLMTWAAGTGDASDLLEALFHTRGAGFGAANRFAYSRRAVDDLVSRAGQTLDPAERRSALWEAFRILSSDVPAVPLLVRASLYAVRPDLEWTQRRIRRLRAADIRPARG